MKWKKALVVLSAALVFLAVSIVGLFIWGMAQLPSAFELKKAITPTTLASSPNSSTPPVDSSVNNDSSEATIVGVPQPTPLTPEQEKQRLNEIGSKVLLEDFTDERRPMVSSCKNLASASNSPLLKDPNAASAKYFFESLANESQDPLTDSGAPIFRYVFRAPGMRTFVEMILQAQENKDFGLLKKTEFYYQIYKVVDYLQAHNDEMNMVLQKSYNIHHIIKAVAQKPELAQESGVVTFCEQMEKTLNEGTGYNADVAEKEMQKFFTDVGVDPASVGYDPKYRAKVKTSLSKTQISLNDTWITQFFDRDIEKVGKAKAKSN